LGPGRRFEEEIDDRLAPQHGYLLDAALGDLLERLGRIEDRENLFSCEVFESDEIFAQRGRRFAHEASVST